jgi:hypothetical protein
MYQLTIATDAGSHTTSHADPHQAGRALLAYAIRSDLYLHGNYRTGDEHSGATDLTVNLLRLGPLSRAPRCVGTATITATRTVAPTIKSLTGVTAS